MSTQIPVKPPSGIDPKPEELSGYAGWWLLVIAVCSAIALAVVYWWGWQVPTGSKPEQLGQMGDYFGGLLNPLVSTLTLFVAISVWRLQKKEVEETRKALEEQAKTAEQQRQEQRFFDLLNVYQRTVDSILMIAKMPGASEFPVQYTGKEAIAHFFRCQPGEFFGSYVPPPQYEFLPEVQYLQIQNIEKRWCSHNDSVSALFDHYFRVIFRILSEAKALLGNQHIRYIKLFRAQLSRSELIILAYNLWLDDEGKKMIPLAKKYGLLKHLPHGRLRTTLEQELPAQVFGRTRAAELAAPTAHANTSPDA